MGGCKKGLLSGVFSVTAVLGAGCVLFVLMTACFTAVAANPRGDVLPARKSGLWEVTVQAHVPLGAQGVRQRALTVTQCTSPEAEPVMLLSVLPVHEQCTNVQVLSRIEGGIKRHDIRLSCKVHEQTVVSEMWLRGDLQSVYAGAYRVEGQGSVSGGLQPVNFQGRWIGKCKSGQRPGDLQLPNGATVNVLDDVRRAEGHSH